MKTSKRSPAPKTTTPAQKKGATTTKAAPKDATATKQPAASAPRERDSRLPKAGTTLTRTWHKKDYEVKVGADEFTYAGKPFPSLSAVAREIIGGAQVNGFRWFGLAARPATKPSPANSTKSTKRAKAKKVPTANEPKIGGDSNDFATPAGQRAALAAAGLAKNGKGAK